MRKRSRSHTFLAAMVVFLLFGIAGCDGSLASVFSIFGSVTPQKNTELRTPPATVSVGGSVNDYTSLVNSLRAQDAVVTFKENVSQPFFSVPGKIIDVKGEEVQVFEYTTMAAAEQEAALVSPNGGSIGTSMVSWMSAPHFYKKGRLIVLYVGVDKTVIALLNYALGTQFAGR